MHCGVPLFISWSVILVITTGMLWGLSVCGICGAFWAGARIFRRVRGPVLGGGMARRGGLRGNM